ncbi:Tim44-like domain protein [mine drainage metagenome]|uniref:Tim44-like domain protein n=1 Tax=mine drainage metagenome TaxID=410659 RepID=A0A1J5T7X4_9ZZZZ
MKRFAILLTIVLTSLSLFAANAEAKRFGGGGSFGKQRTMSAPVQKAPTAAPAATPAQPAVAPQPAGNRWLGPLAGLAIGAGLGALFAHFGMGEGMGSFLMIMLGVFAVMMLISMFRRKQEPAMQYAGAGAPYGGSHEPVQQSYGGNVAAPVAAANIPADFPVDSFLRSAKTSFIRLQAANDRKDLDDIREYTTPEMFAEVSMQLQERGNAPQKTDVVAVNAELLEVVTENDHAIASVRMSGQLRENNDAPESFDEIWHVQKNLKDDRSVWLLAGIQQV